MPNTQFAEHNEVRFVGVRPGYVGIQIQVTAEASNNSITMYTVSAGKTLYLVDWDCCYDLAVGQTVRYYIRDNTNALYKRLLWISAVSSGASNGHAGNSSYPPLELGEGFNFVLVATLGCTVNASFHGWEM